MRGQAGAGYIEPVALTAQLSSIRSGFDQYRAPIQCWYVSMERDSLSLDYTLRGTPCGWMSVCVKLGGGPLHAPPKPTTHTPAPTHHSVSADIGIGGGLPAAAVASPHHVGLNGP